jgi:hypothetical protein
MKMPKIKTKNIKDFSKKIPKKLAVYAFLTFLGILLIFSIISVFIFYQNVTLAQRKEIEVSESPLEFDKITYQQILDIWEQKEKKFNELDSEEHLNIFIKID